jgi:hypothetical protein
MVVIDRRVGAVLWFDREAQDRVPVAEFLRMLLDEHGALDTPSWDPGPSRSDQERSVEAFRTGRSGRAGLLLNGGVVVSTGWLDESGIDRGARIVISQVRESEQIVRDVFDSLCRTLQPRQAAFRLESGKPPEYMYAFGPMIQKRRLDLSIFDTYLAWDDACDYWLGSKLAVQVGLLGAGMVTDYGIADRSEPVLAPLFARGPLDVEPLLLA